MFDSDNDSDSDNEDRNTIMKLAEIEKTWFNDITKKMKSNKPIEGSAITKLIGEAYKVIANSDFCLREMASLDDRLNPDEESGTSPLMIPLEILAANPKTDILWLFEKPTDKEMIYSDNSGCLLMNSRGAYQKTIADANTHIRTTAKWDVKCLTWFVMPFTLTKTNAAAVSSTSNITIDTDNKTTRSSYYVYPDKILLDYIYKWCARLIFFIIKPKVVICFGTGVSRKLASPFGESKQVPSAFEDCAKSAAFAVEYGESSDIDVKFYVKYFNSHKMNIKGRLLNLKPPKIAFISTPHPYTIKLNIKEGPPVKLIWDSILNKLCSYAPSRQLNKRGGIGSYLTSRQKKNDANDDDDNNNNNNVVVQKRKRIFSAHDHNDNSKKPKPSPSPKPKPTIKKNNQPMISNFFKNK